MASSRNLSEYKKLAILHHQVIFAVCNASYVITQKLKERNKPENISNVLTVLSSLDSVPDHIRRFAKGAAKNYSQVKSFREKISEADNKIITELRREMRASETVTGVLKVIQKYRASVGEKSSLIVGLDIGSALIELGKDTVYNRDYMKEVFGLEEVEKGDKNYHGQKATANYSVGGVAAEDVAGAVIGGAAGAVGGAVTTWWAGSGPGAVAGGAGGAAAGTVMFSGKEVWSWLKGWYGGPCHHCPSDPAGPIGPQPIPPERS